MSTKNNQIYSKTNLLADLLKGLVASYVFFQSLVWFVGI